MRRATDSANWGGRRDGAGRPRQLPNGCEIIRGHGVEIGIMQTEIPGKPEAWLWWCDGQSLTSDRGWNYGAKADAIMRINTWLEGVGLALQDGKIVEH